MIIHTDDGPFELQPSGASDDREEIVNKLVVVARGFAPVKPWAARLRAIDMLAMLAAGRGSLAAARRLIAQLESS